VLVDGDETYEAASDPRMIVRCYRIIFDMVVGFRVDKARPTSVLAIARQKKNTKLGPHPPQGC